MAIFSPALRNVEPDSSDHVLRGTKNFENLGSGSKKISAVGSVCFLLLRLGFPLSKARKTGVPVTRNRKAEERALTALVPTPLSPTLN
jgi:hypothetical protein